MVAKESCIRISHSFASFLIVNNRDRLNMILLSNGSISNWIFFLILRINKLVLRIVISSHSFICTYFKQFYRTAKWEMSRKFQEKNSNVKYTQSHIHSLGSFINLNLYLHLIKNAWRQGIFHIYFMFNTIMNCYVFSIWRWIQVHGDARKKYEEEKDEREKNSISNFYHVSFKQPSFRSITFLPPFFFFFFQFSTFVRMPFYRIWKTIK